MVVWFWYKNLLVYVSKQGCEDSIKIDVGDISYNLSWIKLVQDSLSCFKCLGCITENIPNPSQVTESIKIPKYCFFPFGENLDFFYFVSVQSSAVESHFTLFDHAEKGT
jgi:hypothetical protein